MPLVSNSVQAKISNQQSVSSQKPKIEDLKTANVETNIRQTNLQAKSKVSEVKNKRYETEDNYVKYSEGASIIKISDTKNFDISAYEGGQYTSINGNGEDLDINR
jgi:hypothetical protein